MPDLALEAHIAELRLSYNVKDNTRPVLGTKSTAYPVTLVHPILIKPLWNRAVTSTRPILASLDAVNYPHRHSARVSAKRSGVRSRLQSYKCGVLSS